MCNDDGLLAYQLVVTSLQVYQNICSNVTKIGENILKIKTDRELTPYERVSGKRCTSDVRTASFE